LSFQLDNLRLMTRGLERNRRGDKSRSRISPRTVTSARASREGGKCRLVGDVAADDSQGAGEGDPVGIMVRLLCGLVHQVPQGVVHQEKGEDLLFGPVMVLGAQDEAGTSKMGLDLVERALDLPSLGVQGGQRRGRRGSWRICEAPT
jgi:hypothetical protein